MLDFSERQLKTRKGVMDNRGIRFFNCAIQGANF